MVDIRIIKCYASIINLTNALSRAEYNGIRKYTVFKYFVAIFPKTRAINQILSLSKSICRIFSLPPSKNNKHTRRSDTIWMQS